MADRLSGEQSGETYPGDGDRMVEAWKKAAAALRESERRYRELVEYSLGLICTHDLTGKLLSVNPAAATSLGYEPAEGVGRNLREFLAPEKRALFDDYLARIQKNGHDAGLMRLVARDGAVRVWMYRNVLTYREGNDYVLGHAIDITERVEAERTVRESEQAVRAAHAELERRVIERTAELQTANERLRVEIAERERAEQARERAFVEASRLKDEFLGVLSHELRTPLNAIFGWAKILRARDLDARTAHAMEVIERNAEAQIRLIDEVLDVSRIVAGKMTLAMEGVDVASVLRATIDTLRPALQAKAIVLRQQVNQDLPLVQADPHRLQQVFWNLLSNALKFTGRQGIISLSLRVVGTSVEFEITDTGVGIRREILPFVFDRFRQADSSMARTEGGLGLGLAIVRHIVELHGGNVRAASAGEGHGATFTIELPIASQSLEAPAPASVPMNKTETSKLLRGRIVLVVEDHEDARELICAVLQASGAEVVAAALAAEAIELARKSRPDVLVTDLGLPTQDGFELLAAIRDIYLDLPAVALTAYARSTDRVRARSAGFQDYLVKPVDPPELVRIVAQCLRDAR